MAGLQCGWSARPATGLRRRGCWPPAHRARVVARSPGHGPTATRIEMPASTTTVVMPIATSIAGTAPTGCRGDGASHVMRWSVQAPPWRSLRARRSAGEAYSRHREPVQLSEAAEWIAELGARWDARLARLRSYLVEERGLQRAVLSLSLPDADETTR